MEATPRPIRVLLVEDNEDDYIVTRMRLSEMSGPAVELDWVASYAEGLERMKQRAHDVYLVDHFLGPRTGLELLREAGQAGVQAPIIMLTGSGAHDIDVEAMQAGAADYLVKGEINAPLLERSIRYARERSRVLGELQKSRDDMLSIMDRLRLGTAITDPQGRIEFLSEACERLIGRKRDEARGTHWEELWPFRKEDRAALKEMAERPPDKRAKLPVEFEDQAGRRFWLDIEVGDDPRDPARKIFFLYDLTEVRDLRRLLDEKNQFQDLVGKSAPMSRVFQQIRDLAGFDSTVLIEGETGTGKELVARAVHFTSDRKRQPFIAVNCAGLTESLLGSQLFGHKRGAFTGAVEDHKGLFETANGGSIFLDEIGDVPMSVQTSLLRVLQEREITRVGESHPRKIDVRVIAATHHDLKADVEKGTMRLDLLYRLRVVRITLPPLRERREDIPLLVSSFLAKFRALTGKPVHEVSSEAMSVLMAFSWPGNVRELHSSIEYAVIRCRGAVIQLEDLPSEITGNERPRPLAWKLDTRDEKQRILAAIENAKGNLTAAARLLGISRATLYRRLDELGLGRQEEAVEQPSAELAAEPPTRQE